MDDDGADRANGPVDDAGAALGFCVVANVARETANGEGGLDIRSGLKHFAAGAKLWVLPGQWGDGGERLLVVGRHRGSGRRYIQMILPRGHLTDFRVRAVHSPGLLRAMTRPLGSRSDWVPRLWTSREQAQAAVDVWCQPRLAARLVEDQITVEVTDPPPLDLVHCGRRYYLTHFNARRALYSTQLPPAEPSPAIGA